MKSLLVTPKVSSSIKFQILSSLISFLQQGVFIFFLFFYFLYAILTIAPIFIPSNIYIWKITAYPTFFAPSHLFVLSYLFYFYFKSAIQTNSDEFAIFCFNSNIFWLQFSIASLTGKGIKDCHFVFSFL